MTTTALNISSSSTTINNNLISNAQATFNNSTTFGTSSTVSTFYNPIHIYDVGGGSTYGRLVTGPLGMNYSSFNSSGNPTRHQFYITSNGVTTH